MNSKSKKLYSTLAATALVASAVAPVSAAETTTQTALLTTSQIATDAVVNATGTSGDTVTVTGLKAGSVINVYADSKLATKIGTSSIASGDTATTVKVAIAGGFTTTKVYVTHKSGEATESKALAVSVPKEKSTAPAASDLSTTNNVTLKDIVTVKNVEAKDKVTVYSDSEGKTAIGTATAKSGASSVDVQLKAGFGELPKVYVSKTSNGKLESAVTEVAVTGEKSSAFTTADTIEVINNVTLKDQVKITGEGLKEKDVISLYEVGTEKAVATATVKKNAKTKALEAVITVKAGFNAEKTYTITKKSVNEKESTKKDLTVPVEKQSAFTTADTIEVINNVTLKDQVKITGEGLKEKDVISLYEVGTEKAVATATVKKNAKTKALEAVITVKAGFNAEKTYTITKKSVNEKESTKKDLTVPVEKQSAFTTADTVEVINNVTLKDQVKITGEGLKEKDVISLYEVGTEKAVATATVKKNAKTKALEAVITVKAGFNAEKTYAITKKSVNEKESTKKDLTVPVEIKTTLASGDTVTFTNNYAIADEVTFSNLKSKDKVSILSGTTVIGTGTAKADGKLVVKLKSQVDAKATLTATITRTNEVKSAPITITYKDDFSYDKTTNEVTVNGVKKGTGIILKVNDASIATLDSASVTEDGPVKVKPTSAIAAGAEVKVYTLIKKVEKLIGTFKNE